MLNNEAGITLEELKKGEGKKVEIVAFNICYLGILKKVDLKEGTVRITDEGDSAILDIERIQSFQVVS